MSSNAGEVAADLQALGRDTTDRVRQIVATHTARLRSQVQRNASGRPGPNAPTGNYRRSIGHIVTQQAGATVGIVGTNAPQGRRLEFGFTGADSLGRNYNQPAFPHFGPALDDIAPDFIAAMERAGLPAATRGTGR